MLRSLRREKQLDGVRLDLAAPDGGGVLELVALLSELSLPSVIWYIGGLIAVPLS